MVNVSDIKDRASLETWLKDQPREVAVWIASRAAARVLPVWWQAILTEEWAGEESLTPLTVLRNLLISFVAANMPTTELKSAAAAAVDGGIVGLPFSAATNADGAARAAVSAFVLDKPVHSAGSAGFSSSRAVIVNNGAPEVWSAISTDAKQLAQANSQYSIRLWPIESHPLKPEWKGISRRVRNQSDAADWQFWIDWYDALLDVRPMLGDAARTWEMLEQIALIDPETWDKGPEVVNPVIREIWEGYQESGMGVGRAADPEPVSDDAKSAMKQRVAVNRDALTVSGAGLVDQLGAFRDRVRGMNHLQPEAREEVLAFIDEFTSKLWVLLEGLPPPGEAVNDADAGRLVLWLREYRGLLRQKLAYYGSPENMAEATVPTGIILGATGIGAMLGMPVAGSVVGGLIVNQMKPGQAAKELTARSIKDGDAG